MKKSTYFVLVVIFCWSCSSKSSSEASAEGSTGEISTAEKVEPEVVQEAELQERGNGLSLIEGSDCQACHQDKQRLVGPSYEEIAARYASSYSEERERLVSTVLKGGSGVWGEVPMTAHPQHTTDEIVLMLEYIMTFK